MENKKRKVFISHSSVDKGRIDELAKSLDSLGCDIFYSSDITTNKINYGTSNDGIYGQIKREISNADVVLFMVSENFYSSIASVIEVGIAYALEKEMIPVSFKSGNYKEDLKAIFNHTQLLASLDNPDDVMRLLAQISNSTDAIKMYECQKRVVEAINSSKDEEEHIVGQCSSDIKEFKNINDETAIDCIAISTEVIEIASKFRRLSNFDYLFIKYICEDRVNEFSLDSDYTHWSNDFRIWRERENIYISNEDNHNEKFIRLLDRYNLLEKFPSIYFIKSLGIEVIEFIYDRDKHIIDEVLDREYCAPFQT